MNPYDPSNRNNGYGPPPGAPPQPTAQGTPYGYGTPGMPSAPHGSGPIIQAAPFGIEPMSGLPYSPKSRVVAAVLQFAFGVFGAGRFYTGHIGLALAQLFFSWLTCGIWPIVDGVMMLTGKVKDSEGRPLRE